MVWTGMQPMIQCFANQKRQRREAASFDIFAANIQDYSPLILSAVSPAATRIGGIDGKPGTLPANRCLTENHLM
ncbi:hypothetical protein [Haladaptatus sp. CMAA 1911]|uniref:hypothetical protein n=1 Tax=unclassified Haladaptatus TaxID=2622732 RepID=UPI003754AAA0